MEPSVQQMRRRSTLLSTVFQFKKVTKSHVKSSLTSLSPFATSSTDSLNFIPNYVQVKVLQATISDTKNKQPYERVFAKVSVGKEKYETIPQKGTDSFCWENQILTLEIPDEGNKAAITVALYHRRRLVDDCLGVTVVFLREFQPSQKERLMTCNLQSKDQPAQTVGEVVLSVAFRASRQPPSSAELHLAEFASSSKSLNVFGHNLLAAGHLRRNSSFNSVTEHAFPSKPVQHVTPVVHVTNSGTDAESDREDSFTCVTSARGRVNSLFDLEGAHEEEVRKASDATIRLSNASSTSQESQEDLKEVSEEFKGKSKTALVRMIVALREVVSEQDEKVTELQNYIDTRLASILDANPSLLEAPLKN